MSEDFDEKETEKSRAAAIRIASLLGERDYAEEIKEANATDAEDKLDDEAKEVEIILQRQKETLRLIQALEDNDPDALEAIESNGYTQEEALLRLQENLEEGLV